MARRLKIILLLLATLAAGIKDMPKIRTEINILTALLTAASGSSATSNEIIRLDKTKYNGALTYYFEVIADASVSLAFNVTLRRFGTSTDDATCSVPTLTTTPTRIRSSSFTPPAGATEYVVFIDAGVGATKNVRAARLIIIQEADPITLVENQIEVGGTQSFTGTTFAALTNPKYWNFDSAKWDSGVSAFFEATFKRSGNATATVEIQVADGTGDGFAGWAAVAGGVTASDVTTTSSTPVRVRTTLAFTPIAGRNYRVVVKTSSTKSAVTIYNAKIIIGRDTWALVGSGLGLANGVPALAALSSSTVAFFDNTNDSLRKYSFNGSTWSLVGNGFTIATTGVPALAALSASEVAYLDGGTDSLRKYSFDGTDWSLVGNAFTLAVSAPALAALSSSRVAFMDDTVDALRAYDFDGTNWSLVGNSFTLASGRPALAALSSTRVAFIDDTNNSLRAYDFDGTNWSLVGNGLSLTVGIPALAALSSTRVAVYGATGLQLRLFDFDGTNWAEVGVPLTFSGSGRGALAALAPNRIAYIDDALDSLRAYDMNYGAALSKLEAQYLLANALLAAGTALQNFDTLFDPEEWSGVNNVYLHQVESANGSTSDAKLQSEPNGTPADVANSNVDNPDNAGRSAAMTMPATAKEIDVIATTNNNDLYASRILAQVLIELFPAGYAPRIEHRPLLRM